MEIRKIKKALNKHGIIAFPTETVMGLGVFYDDFEAYEKLNKVKQRREDKPYTMMLGDPKKIIKYADVDHNARKLISAFMPGSVTLLLHAKENVPSYVTHGTGVVGVRVPSLVDILDMLNQLGKPLLVPSANKAGEKPAFNSEEVKNIFGNEIDYVVEGECVGGVASTIIDLTTPEVKIIREGPVTKEMINSVLGGE